MPDILQSGDFVSRETKLMTINSQSMTILPSFKEEIKLDI